MRRMNNRLTEHDRDVIDHVNLWMGVFIILVSIYTFWNGQIKTYMFPVIFVVAAFMNCMWGVKLSGDRKWLAVICFAVGILLFFIAVFVAV